MRTFLITAATLLTVGLGASAFATTPEDAAYDQYKGAVIDSRGNCVRTMWQGGNDPCAKDSKAARPSPRLISRPARLSVSEREARTLYFDFNKATLTAESKAKLDELAEVINNSSSITDVTIHGFTDQLGSDSYNAALAEKRVAAAKAYLDSKSRIKAEGDIKGLGKANPEESCDDINDRAEKIACMAKERRVEIEFNANR